MQGRARRRIARDDDDGTNSGAVYVYRRDDEGWVFLQKLTGAEAGEPWAIEPPGSVSH